LGHGGFVPFFLAATGIFNLSQSSEFESGISPRSRRYLSSSGSVRQVVFIKHTIHHLPSDDREGFQYLCAEEAHFEACSLPFFSQALLRAYDIHLAIPSFIRTLTLAGAVVEEFD
jgi:hypothetical protein